METEIIETTHAPSVPARVRGKHLTQAQISLLLLLRDGGLLETEIAARPELSCSVSTVSRTLAQFSDTRTLARRHLESSALPVARSVVRASRSDGNLGCKVLTGLGLLSPAGSPSVAVQVNVGGAETTLPTIPTIPTIPMPPTLGAP